MIQELLPHICSAQQRPHGTRTLMLTFCAWKAVASYYSGFWAKSSAARLAGRVGLHDGPGQQVAERALHVGQRLGERGQEVRQQEVRPGHLAHRRRHAPQRRREELPRVLAAA